MTDPPVGARKGPRLSLDCLTLTDTKPEELIRSAAAAGFNLVSLWLNPLAAFQKQVVSPATVDVLVELLAETEIRVHQIEAFDLASREQVESFRPQLEMAARLGAKTVLVYNGVNPDRHQVVKLLRLACNLAGEYGLGVNVEPVSMGKTRTLLEAQELIRDCGADAGIVLDLLHHVRTGGNAARIRASVPEFIRYVQINDGLLDLPPDQWIMEAMAERYYPGEGEFPLQELLREVSQNIPWGIETPSRRRHEIGQRPDQQARHAMAALSAVLQNLQ